jgi:hypothetical protein
VQAVDRLAPSALKDRAAGELADLDELPLVAGQDLV